MAARPIISRSPARTKSLPVKVRPYSIVYTTDNVEHLPKLLRITSNHSIPLLSPHLSCPLAPVDQVPSSRTRVSLLPAHLYPTQGPEKLLPPLRGTETCRSLYRKRMPESGSTRTGSNNRDHRKWQIGSHLHTHPTEKLIPLSYSGVRFLSSEICMFYSDDFVTTGLCDPFVYFCPDVLFAVFRSPFQSLSFIGLVSHVVSPICILYQWYHQLCPWNHGREIRESIHDSFGIHASRVGHVSWAVHTKRLSSTPRR